MKRLVKQYVVEVYEVENSCSLDKNELKDELASTIKNALDVAQRTKIQKLIDAKNKRYQEIMLNSYKN